MGKAFHALSVALLTGAAMVAHAAGEAKTGDAAGSRSAAETAVHTAKGTIKRIDSKSGVVTFAHEPVKSLNWPAMVMGFKVKDRALLDKLAEGQTVQFDFVRQGSDYVVTAIR